MHRYHIDLEPLGGIAGDMFVAAMLDAFPELIERVLSDVAAVLPPSAGEVCLVECVKNGMVARHFSLLDEGGAHVHPPHDVAPHAHAAQAGEARLHEERHTGSASHEDMHTHGDEHTGEHSHGHAHAHSHVHGHSHGHAHAHSHVHGHSHGHTHGHDHAGEHSHGQTHSHDHSHPENHAHSHGHGHHHEHPASSADGTGHTHDHAHPHPHPHTPSARVQGEIREIAHTHGKNPAHDLQSDYQAICAHIMATELSTGTREAALSILRVIAEAEAAIHGVSIEAVHFHELAAWDSLMDVVAAGSIMAALAHTTWGIASLPLGQGYVNTQHGLLPVPAPATARILTGYAWHRDAIKGERVTPTGAAIVRALTSPHDPVSPPTGRLARIGYGAGTKIFAELPNVLRVSVFEVASERHSTASTDVLLIEFDIDDMSGEEMGIAADYLRASAGVLDLTIFQGLGKKSRPQCLFRLLIDPLHFEAIKHIIFHETSTIGFRHTRMQRETLPRTLSAEPGGLMTKTVQRLSGEYSTKVESDSLAAHRGLVTRRHLKFKHEGAQ